MWKDLTMNQKSEVIQMAIKNGIKDLDEIKSFYDNSLSNKFEEGGPKNNSYKYIGGGTEEVRIEALNRAPKLKQLLSTLAKEYNVPASLLAYRLGQEGLLDILVNKDNASKENLDLDNPHFPFISSFKDLGMDDSFYELSSGKANSHRYIPYAKGVAVNELGRVVYPANTESNIDKLELFTAILAGRKQRAAKRGYSGEDLIKATNRSYNAGEYSKLPLDKYGIAPYDTITFPKAENYKQNYHDNNFKPKNIEEAINYINEYGHIDTYANGNIIEYNPIKGSKSIDLSPVPIKSVPLYSFNKHEIEGIKKAADQQILNKKKALVNRMSNLKIDDIPEKISNNNLMPSWSRFDLGGPLDDYIYTASPLDKEVVVTADAPIVHYDGFNYIGYNDLGQRHIKGNNFNPSGAYVIQDPIKFENLRLNQAKQADINRTHAFGDSVRKLATGLTLTPAAITIGGPLLNTTVRGLDKAATLYNSLPLGKRELIEGAFNSTFGALGLHNFLGPEGHDKTKRFFDEGNYGRGLISMGGDILDLSMLYPIGKGLLSPSSWKSIAEDAEHLYSQLSNPKKSYRALKKWYNTDKRLNHFLDSSDAYKNFIQNYYYNKNIEQLNNISDLEQEINKVLILRWKLESKYNLGKHLHPKGFRENPNYRDGIDIETVAQKGSYENIEKLLNKYGKGNLIKYYNPKTKSFEYTEINTNFNPKDAVTTGNIEIINARTGKPETFYLDPEQVTSSTISKTYRFPSQAPIKETTEARAIYPELPKDYQQAIQDNIDFVTKEALPNSKVFGSSSNVAAGNLYHDAHDIDVIMTQKQAFKHPAFKKWTTMNGVTYQYNHPTAGELDINILQNNKEGLAIGARAHELYAQLYPKQYANIIKKAVKESKFRVNDIPLDKTPEELLENYDPVVKSISDAFMSGKDKHMKRANYLLHYGKIEDVQKGFNNYANYIIGGDYKPSNVPIEAFNNPEKNKEILEFLGLNAINKEQFINDPERMKLLFEYEYFHEGFLGRGVSSSNDDVIKSLTYWYPDTYGGTASGAGLNTVLGGDSGYGNVYGTLVPEKLGIEIVTKDPIEALHTRRALLGHQNLSPEQIRKIEDIANKHNIDIDSPDSFRKALQQTEGKKGQNYKNFLSDLEEEFSIAGIQGKDFDGLFVSTTRDVPEEGLKQIMLDGMDRPVNPIMRDDASKNRNNNSYESFYDDLMNLEVKSKHRRNNSDTYRPFSNTLNKYNKQLKELRLKNKEIAPLLNSKVKSTDLKYKKFKDKYYNRKQIKNDIISVGKASSIIGGVASVGALLGYWIYKMRDNYTVTKDLPE